MLLAAAPAAAAEDPFAHGCPPEALEEGGLEAVNRNQASAHVLVPGGAVRVQLCRYWGFAGPDGNQTKRTQARAGKLRDRRTLRGHEVVRLLAREFDSLETTSNRPMSCPMDEGARMYAVFRYADAPPVPVEVHLSGCQTAYNGRAERARWMTSGLREWLERLLTRHSLPTPPPSVHGKRIVTYPPPYLPFARGKHSIAQTAEELCDGRCSSWSLRKCHRTSSVRMACHFVATTPSAERCPGQIEAKAIEEDAVMLSYGPSGEECAARIFIPAEILEMVEEAEREEQRESAKAPA